MTPREQRLQRLADLREKQHDAATVRLRAARHALHETEQMLQQGVQQARDAHEGMASCLEQEDQLGWLLASADVEFSKLSIAAAAGKRAAAVAVVHAAAAHEADARRERKQMEKTLELIAKEEATLASRKEQQEMEETSRLVRRASSNPLYSGRSH